MASHLKTVRLADGEQIRWHVANTIRAQLHHLDERDGIALKALIRKCQDASYQFIHLPTYGNPRTVLREPVFFDAQRKLTAFINDKDEVDAIAQKIVLEALEIQGDKIVFKGPWAKV